MMNKYSQHAIMGKAERLEMIKNSGEHRTLMELEMGSIIQVKNKASLWPELTDGLKTP